MKRIKIDRIYYTLATKFFDGRRISTARGTDSNYHLKQQITSFPQDLQDCSGYLSIQKILKIPSISGGISDQFYHRHW
jgi:hypothetical protein